VSAVTRTRFSKNKVLNFYERPGYETDYVCFEMLRLACLPSILKKFMIMEYVHKNSQVYGTGDITNSENSEHFHFKFNRLFLIWVVNSLAK
jgi:hypothetical protein